MTSYLSDGYNLLSIEVWSGFHKRIGCEGSKLVSKLLLLFFFRLKKIELLLYCIGLEMDILDI